MNKGLKQKIKETEIAKRIIAPLPPWWRKVRDYSAVVFVVATGMVTAAPIIGISAVGVTIIQVILVMSGAISGMAQFTKK